MSCMHVPHFAYLLLITFGLCCEQYCCIVLWDMQIFQDRIFVWFSLVWFDLVCYGICPEVELLGSMIILLLFEELWCCIHRNPVTL